MIGGSLLSQGGYGCVFHPEINCKGKETTKKKYISKIQKNDFSAENEISIGKHIEKAIKTKEEHMYFAPVISQCPINVSKIKVKGVDECKIIEGNNVTDFLLMKIRYINGGVLDTFISENKNSSLIFSLFVSILSGLLKRVEFLIQNNIIHFDIKGQNIIYNKSSGQPVIIDFGLSIPVEKLQHGDDLYHYFYIYAPEYYIWPLEVHLFNFLENVSEHLTMKNIKSLAHDYVKNNWALHALSPGFRKKYEEMCVHVLKKYLGVPVPEIKREILQYWKTWDNYSVSIMYLKYVYMLFGTDNTVEKNPYLIFLTKILLTNIHPDPARRISVAKTLQTFEKIPFNANIDQINVLNQLIETIGNSRKNIHKRLKQNETHMTLLTNKILSKKQ